MFRVYFYISLKYYSTHLGVSLCSESWKVKVTVWDILELSGAQILHDLPLHFFSASNVLKCRLKKEPIIRRSYFHWKCSGSTSTCWVYKSWGSGCLIQSLSDSHNKAAEPATTFKPVWHQEHKMSTKLESISSLTSTTDILLQSRITTAVWIAVKEVLQRGRKWGWDKGCNSVRCSDLVLVFVVQIMKTQGLVPGLYILPSLVGRGN